MYLLFGFFRGSVVSPGQGQKRKFQREKFRPPVWPSTMLDILSHLLGRCTVIVKRGEAVKSPNYCIEARLYN
uniref:Uncharacterized protein n=1 Tax=Vespula pensylvanica TaxID=30213 RepID=A0A834P4Z1_VESPE|nr:hypothetical protein H0235_007070 [Vespula pensylvanica]